MKALVKKILFFCLYFLSFSIIINSIFLGLIMTTDWDFVKRIESLTFKNPDYELLVLGSSLAEYGIDAELLTKKGIGSFNLALVGSDTKTNYIQLDEYLRKYNKKPHFVVLAINSYLEQFDQEGIQPIVEFTMKGQKIDINDIPISKFGWHRTELFKKLFSKEYRNGYVSHGQIRRSKTVMDNSVFHEKYINIEKYTAAKWIGKIARLCKDFGIELIIVEMPGVKEAQNISEIGPYVLTYGDGGWANLFNLNSRKFCEFINPGEDWVGLSHFNQTGAAKFTEKLLNITPLRIFCTVNADSLKTSIASESLE